MSLIRFLRATRSLEGSDDKPNPYRLPEQNLLPKFGSPARGRTRAQEDLGRNADKHKHKNKDGQPMAAGADLDSAKREPVNLSATAQTKTGAMEGKRTWMFWRNWFAPKPLKAAAPVQSEFALDGVKVVRNDLSESEHAGVKSAKLKTKNPDMKDACVLSGEAQF